jgi:hypothetical protein
VVVDLYGHQLRTHLKAITGSVGGGAYADPAVISSGSGSVTRRCYFRIPFHGGHGGVLGYRGFEDLLQPCDRFREADPIVIDWGSATPFEAASTGTITAATLELSAVIEPLSDLIQGVDLRHIRGRQGDDQLIRVPLNGIRVHTVALTNTDLDHSDYTVVTVRPISYLTNKRPRALIAAWNGFAGLRAMADQENPRVGEFLPIVWPHRKGKLLNCKGFAEGTLEVELTNTHATTQYFSHAQVFNTSRLASLGLRTQGTIYWGRRLVKPRYSSKNQASVEANKGAFLEALLPQKLVRPR